MYQLSIAPLFAMIMAVTAAIPVAMSTVWPPPDPPVPERWHAWPVTRVFPGTVPGLSPSGARVTYVLAGVAPEASCAAAFQPGIVRTGCRVALRATYADSTQTFVATVGIAVLDEPVLDRPAFHGFGPAGHGLDGWRPAGSGPAALGFGPFDRGRPATVRPVAFPGGPAERFGERQYFTGAVVGSGERYLVATAAGYADGRPYRPGHHTVPRLRQAAWQLATALHRALTR
ncbi:hypothetical protein [Nonomuraea jiangxiensis]|uniref:Uncharacterized protein n=1 Tax=Nonomuraea jiangxiensis TaxID=633440 RepID=A0A1G9W469_9ACTN|nr:hypothetical protein [Nonomuraea jiangxiensis]SDM78981.1 hypothetical protein SAMN05421869_15610 [Nonomuraea jiangxiensis]